MGNVEYTKAVFADHEDLVDFGNYVFKVDFIELLPKLYKPEYKKDPDHYIVKENGKIKAAVGSYPMEMRVCGRPLKVAGIGMVSVHPYSRRKGYMRALMDRAMEDMKKNQVDLACLGGLRQRYAYYSFEPCGPELEFHVTMQNLRYVYGDDRETGVTLSKVEAGDTELLEKMKELHDKQPSYVVREGNFYDVLKSWCNVPYAVYEKGEFIGYAVTDGNCRNVFEIVLKEEKAIEKVVRASPSSLGSASVNFHCAPWQQSFIGYLESVAERHLVALNSNFTVLNYVNVLDALMELKSTYGKLADGELTVCVQDVQCFKISVKDGKPSVKEYDGKCDVTLPHLKAMRFFFAPAAAFYDYGVDISPEVRSWFPLPLFYPKQDMV